MDIYAYTMYTKMKEKGKLIIDNLGLWIGANYFGAV